MIETVIFDLDGVIIDSEPVHFTLEKQMFDELNIRVSDEEHQSFAGMSSQNMWDRLVKNFKLPYAAEALVNKKQMAYMNYLQKEYDLRPIPNIPELIKDLFENDFKLAIASSSRLDVIDAVLTKFNLFNFFMEKVSGASLRNSKPDPEIFLVTAELLYSRPEECLVIEDSENGVKAAKAASMKCIGFRNPNSGAQDLSRADIIINSFEEISAEKIRSF